MQQSPDNEITESQEFKTKLLIVNELIDPVDELDRNWCQQNSIVESLIQNLSENESTVKLQNSVNESQQKYIDITCGLLYGFLTGDNQNSPNFKYLTLISKDSMASTVSQLLKLVEKYQKLQDRPRERFLILIGELIKTSVHETENLCIALLRYITSGDVSQKNLWLMNTLLTLFNKNWILSQKKLIPFAVYTFLSQIPFHLKHQSTNLLAQKEIKFCIDIMKEKLTDLLVIGRDFIRVFYDLVSIPEFEEIWKANSQKCIEALVQPTQKQYLQYRLTPDMEKHLLFMMTDVKVGNQRRYQQWFTMKYISAPENDHLIIDLIRYMVIVFHPPNQLLASNFVPRWMLLGWLIKSVKTQQNIGLALLNLIYDWIFFNQKMDSIMNLEPAMLLMVHSLPRYVDITVWVLECLLGSMKATNWILPSEQLIENVQKAIKTLVGKGVVPSLGTLMECKEINQGIKENLKTYFPGEIEPKKKLTVEIPKNNQKLEKGLASPEQKSPILSPFSTNKSPLSPISPIQKEKTTPNIPPSSPTNKDPLIEKKKEKPVISDLSVFDPYLSDLGKYATNKEKSISNLNSVLDILERENVGQHLIRIGEYFSRTFSFDYGQKTTESHLDSIFYDKTPLKTFFERFQKILPNEDLKRNYMILLNEMIKYEPSLGYRILCFCITKSRLLHLIFDLLPKQVLEVSKDIGSLDFYDFIVKERLNSNLTEKDVFLNDMNVLCEENPALLVLLLPILTQNLSRYCVGNPEFIHLVLFHSHPNIFEKLYHLTLMGRIKLIGREAIYSMIEKSIEWEYYESNGFWSLLSVELLHERDVDLTQLLKFIFEKIKSPNPKLIDVYKREPDYQPFKIALIHHSDNFFSSSLLLNWIKYYSVSFRHFESFLKEMSSLQEKQVYNSLLNIIHLLQMNEIPHEIFEFVKLIDQFKEMKSCTKLIEMILEDIDNKKRKRDENQQNTHSTEEEVKSKKRKIITEDD